MTEAKKNKTFKYEGVTIKVDADIADDVEVLDLVDQIQNENNTLRAMKLIKHLIGQEKYDEILEAYKKNHKTKKMPATEVETLITQLFEALDPKD